MSEDAFAETCLRMEAAYAAIRQGRPGSGSTAPHVSIVQQMQVIQECRYQLISDVGERRAYRFEQLIKAQVLEDDVASDDSLTHSDQPLDACRCAALPGIYSRISFF